MSFFTRLIFEDTGEFRKIQKFVRSVTPGPASQVRVLDVGCGYGKVLRWLTDQGYQATGIDIREETRTANTQSGLRCISPEEFKVTKEEYDVIVMCHVIEHLQPDALLAFLDYYIGRLRAGGHLLIVTPLLSNYIYDDFDHIKPYHPNGILMVFGHYKVIQYSSKARLELEKLWYRRRYVDFHHLAGRHVVSASTPWIKLLDYVMAVAFRLSFGLIGETVAWTGLYRKL